MKFGDIYSQWNLKSTPFAVEALRCDAKGARLLQGRDDDITSVMHKLHRNARITCIDGQYGSGKTSLVNVAIYKCLEAFKKHETNHILIPCKVAFQLKDDLDVDEFSRNVLYHVILALRAHEDVLKPVCDMTGFDDFSRLLSSPILKLESGDVSNSANFGIPGVASMTVGARGAAAEAANTTPGYNNVGFEVAVKDLLDRLFTSVNGGVVCGSSSFRVEPNSHNDSWSSSPVGMCAGRWPACAHVHEACLIRRMSPWALP